MIIVVIILYQLLITVNNTDTLNFQIRYYNFGKILQIWSSHMAQMLDSEEFWRISEQVPLAALTIVSVPLTFWDIYFMSRVFMSKKSSIDDLYTRVRPYTPLYILVHSCTPLYNLVHPCTPLYTLLHPCTHLYTLVCPCTPLYTFVQLYTALCNLVHPCVYGRIKLWGIVSAGFKKKWG